MIAEGLAHAGAPQIQLFIVVPPGFEDLARDEIFEKFPLKASILAAKGGLSLTIPSELVPEFHYQLKIPTSIRERLYEFKCRDFPKLYNKVQSIPWREHLVGDAFELAATAEQSRLNNEKRIVETVGDGIRRYFAKQPPKKPAEPYCHKIYVRFDDDICTISRDLSGAPLFQRGYKELSAVAPIRENLAAGLFYALWRACDRCDGDGSQHGSKSSRGFDVLVDPMCGSGTLLLEASLFWQTWNRHAKVPGGDYASLHDARWNGNGNANRDSSVSKSLSRFCGFDRDKVSLQNVRQSVAKLYGRESSDTQDITQDITQGPDRGTISWTISQCDLFSDKFSGRPVDLNFGPDNPDSPDNPDHIAFILNPPYGVRIRSPKSATYYERILKRLLELQAQNAAIGIVVPKTYAQGIDSRQGQLRRCQVVNFKNGGIDVQFQIFLRDERHQ